MRLTTAATFAGRLTTRCCLTLNCNRGAATADHAGCLGGQPGGPGRSKAKAEEAAAAQDQSQAGELATDAGAVPGEAGSQESRPGS